MKRLKKIVQKGTQLIPLDVKRITRSEKALAVRRHRLFIPIANFVQKRKALSYAVLLPWILAAEYILLLQSPAYQSSAKVLIEKSAQQGTGDPFAAIMGSSGPSKPNIYLTRDYILSRELLEKVDNKVSLKKHFSSWNIDFISRMSHYPTQLSFLDYYRSHVKADINAETNEIVIGVTAFSPQAAQTILSEIINETRNFVNRVSNTLAQKQYDFAQTKLKSAKENLFVASKRLIEWQNKNGFFDPKETAHVISAVMGKLKGTLVEKQTQLITYSAFMQPNASKIITLNEEIKALKEQIREQTSVLLGKEKDDKLNQVLIDFEMVQLELKFAHAEFQAAQQAYQLASTNLINKQNILIEIESPNLPDEVLSPKPITDLLNILVLLLIIFGITKMTITIVREHRA